MNSKTVIAALKRAGWVVARQRGSHVQLKKMIDGQSRLVTVPNPKKDIPIGTLRNIAKQADMKVKDLQ